MKFKQVTLYQGKKLLKAIPFENNDQIQAFPDVIFDFSDTGFAARDIRVFLFADSHLVVIFPDGTTIYLLDGVGNSLVASGIVIPLSEGDYIAETIFGPYSDNPINLTYLPNDAALDVGVIESNLARVFQNIDFGGLELSGDALSLAKINNANLPSVSNLTNNTVGSNSAKLKINHIDEAPTVSVADVSANEIDCTAEFTISIDAVFGQDVTVDYSLNGGATTQVTIFAGTTSTTVTALPWTDDTVDEVVGDEAQTLVISNPKNAALGTSSATLTINDDDAAPTVSVADVNVNEAAGTANFLVSIDAASSQDVTIDYSLNGGAAVQTTILAGTTSTRVTAAPWVDDAIDEAVGDDAQFLVISNPVNATLGKNKATLTINDDDATPIVSVADMSVYEAVGTADFTVSIDAVSGQDVIVDYSLNGGATAQSTILAGTTSTTVTAVAWTDDAIDEVLGDAAQNLVISNPSNAALGKSSATLTVIDDDTAPIIGISDINAAEALGSATFTVTLSAASGQIVTVDYKAPDATTGTLTFAAGETSQTFTTAWTDDALDEIDEVVTASLSNPANATFGTSNATLTIKDDDSPPIVSVADVSANEAAGIAEFTVSIGAVSGQDVIVDYSLNGGATAQAIILAGTTSIAVTATAWADDAFDEFVGDISQSLVISNPTNATLGTNSATLSINDDDAAPTISIADISAAEALGVATFTVTLSAASGKIVTVDYTAPDTTTGTLTFAAGETSKTFTTGWTDDAIYEASETGVATLSNSNNATIFDGSGLLNIVNDDFMSVFNLSSLDGTNGFRLDGEAALDHSGRQVSNAGDVNGDGYGDLIIGAFSANPNGNSSGSSYVVFGKSSGFTPTTDLSSLDGSNGFRLDGETADNQSGWSVSNAGDIDGNGYDDLIIGAIFADANGSYGGSSYVVFGKANGFMATMDLSSLDGTNGFRLDGVAAEDSSGWSVSDVGDFNGDGYDDIIIGAIYAGNGGDNSGSSYVVFGAETGFTPTMDLSTLNGTNGFRLDGEAAYDSSGWSLSGAGDVNGDSYDDLIIGARYADPNGSKSGSSYVVFGQAGGFAASMSLSTLNGTNGFRLDGEVANDESGYSVSSAGDVNGDGYDDLIIGAHFAASNGSESGSSYVVFGKASGFTASMDLSTLNGINGFQIDGVAIWDQSGFSTSSAGDVNGDGYDDLIIGAIYASNTNNQSGSSYVVFGAASGFTATMDLSTLDGVNGFRLDGVDVSDNSGWSVSSAGDIDGDGYDDLLIGVPYDDPNGLTSGSSYVVFGGNAWASATQAGTVGMDTLTGTAADDTLIAGDSADILIGAGGVDVLRGGAGDDVISVTDLSFQQVDGGGGSDTLILDGSGLSLDLTAANHGVENIEVLNITGGGNNSLTLDAQSVIQLSDSSNSITIDGDAGDNVIIDDLADWTVVNVAGDYTSYSNGALTLLIDDDVLVA